MEEMKVSLNHQSVEHVWLFQCLSPHPVHCVRKSVMRIWWGHQRFDSGCSCVSLPLMASCFHCCFCSLYKFQPLTNISFLFQGWSWRSIPLRLSPSLVAQCSCSYLYWFHLKNNKTLKRAAWIKLNPCKFWPQLYMSSLVWISITSFICLCLNSNFYCIMWLKVAVPHFIWINHILLCRKRASNFFFAGRRK